MVAGRPPFTFRSGARLRGDHPAVRAAPQAFVPDGTPPEEMPIAEVRIEQHQPEFHRPAPSIPDSEAVEARVNFTTGLGYAPSVVKGQRFRRDDPLVKAKPRVVSRAGPALRPNE